MKILLKTYLLLIIFVITNSVYCLQSTNDENSRQKININQNWKFYLGDLPTAANSDFDDSEWRNLDLPHDWSIEGKIERNNPTGSGGGYVPAGVGWYRKKILIPSSWKGKHISIYFEGVYMNSEVFINGISLGKHPYGYTSFFYELTPYINYNEENIISVRVDNSEQMNSRWYSGSGIYRNVWLNITEPIHIEQWGVAITSTIDQEKAIVNVKTLLKNETSLPQYILVSTIISDEKSTTFGTDEVEIELKVNEVKEIVQDIIINNPKLWSPETPNLYNAQIKIISDKEIVDISNNTFGIRSIMYSSEYGFQLNGKTIKLNGGCVHHDNGCLGAAAYDRAEERKVELLKDAGFNAVRTAHNPPSEAFLNACDKLGIMVVDESFDCWEEGKNTYDYSRFFKEWWKKDIESMVLRDRNHPSIIMWSIGNEIIERTKPEAVENATKLAKAIRRIDPTRPITSAMTTWNQGWEIFDTLMAVHDVCGYNYQLQRAPSDHERVPSRIILQTESYPGDAFFCWNMVQSNNYIIGDFVWTALDYLGESGIGRYYYDEEPKGEHWEGDFFPWHGAYCGDINLIGWRKPISHYRNLLWNDTEKLYMAVKEPKPENGEIKSTLWSVYPSWESWNWPSYIGKNIDVEVYSKYPKVRLYLNDKLIGEKTTGKEQEYKAVFTLLYFPGVLKATGVLADQDVESKILKTSDKASKIRLKADRTSIIANGQDLSYITIEITDKEGNIDPISENLLHFNINGPGTIAGVDNANLKDLDQYVSTERKAWHGRALLIIKSTNNKGEIKFRVTSKYLKSDEVVIFAE